MEDCSGAYDQGNDAEFFPSAFRIFYKKRYSSLGTLAGLEPLKNFALVFVVIGSANAIGASTDRTVKRSLEQSALPSRAAR